MAYIPCEGSIYHHPQIFENLAEDIVEIKDKYNGPISLIGDINARTGLLPDTTEFEAQALRPIHTGIQCLANFVCGHTKSADTAAMLSKRRCLVSLPSAEAR